MRAWRFVGRGRPLELQELPRPEPGPGEVVVRIRSAGLCHSDLHIVDGDWGFPTPLTLGHEGAGDIAAVGRDVENVRVGERVAVHGANACEGCKRCVEGRGNLCERRQQNGLTIDGMFADFVRCRAGSVLRLPDSVAYEAAAVATDAVLTPYHALRTIACLRAGERVAIFGLGGLGLHAVQVATAARASVIGIDPDLRTHDVALELGATAVLQDGSDLAGEKVDLAADLVGSEETHLQAQMGVREGGRVVLVGLGSMTGPLVAWRYGSQEISTLGAFWGTRDELLEVVHLLQDGTIRAIVETHPLDSVNDQLERLRSGKVLGRIALVP